MYYTQTHTLKPSLRRTDKREWTDEEGQQCLKQSGCNRFFEDAGAALPGAQMRQTNVSAELVRPAANIICPSASCIRGDDQVVVAVVEVGCVWSSCKKGQMLNAIWWLDFSIESWVQNEIQRRFAVQWDVNIELQINFNVTNLLLKLFDDLNDWKHPNNKF